MLKKMRDRVRNWMYPKDTCPADMMYNLLFGDNLPATEDIERTCGLEIAKRPIQVAVIRVGDDACYPEMLRAIIKFCTGSSGSDEVLSVSDGCNQVILLFFCDILWQEQIRRILEDIQKEFISVWSDTRIYITLGTVENYDVDGEPSWRKSYKKAIGLQDYRYVKQKGKIITYSDIVSRRQMYPKGVIFHFDLLKKYLETDDLDLIQDWISDTYTMLSDKENDALGLRYHLTLEIVVNVVSLLRERGLSVETLIGSPEIIIGEVLNIETLQGMQRWTETFLEKCHKILLQSDVG